MRASGTITTTLLYQKGLTLIEVIIVIAIIGLLAAISIPSYLDYSVRSKIAEVISVCGVESRNILTKHHIKRGYFPSNQSITSRLVVRNCEESKYVGKGGVSYYPIGPGRTVSKSNGAGILTVTLAKTEYERHRPSGKQAEEISSSVAGKQIQFAVVAYTDNKDIITGYELLCQNNVYRSVGAPHNMEESKAPPISRGRFVMSDISADTIAKDNSKPIYSKQDVPNIYLPNECK